MLVRVETGRLVKKTEEPAGVAVSEEGDLKIRVDAGKNVVGFDWRMCFDRLLLHAENSSESECHAQREMAIADETVGRDRVLVRSCKSIEVIQGPLSPQDRPLASREVTYITSEHEIKPYISHLQIPIVRISLRTNNAKHTNSRSAPSRWHHRRIPNIQSRDRQVKTHAHSDKLFHHLVGTLPRCFPQRGSHIRDEPARNRTPRPWPNKSESGELDVLGYCDNEPTGYGEVGRGEGVRIRYEPGRLVDG
jgi:hypothetical protein